MFKKIKQLRNNGFTLVEILVVLFIISLLMLLVLPNVGKHRGTAEGKTDQALVSTIQNQVELYQLEHNRLPQLTELELNANQRTEVDEKLTMDSNGNVSLIKDSTP